MRDEEYMRLALEQAEIAGARYEIPIGAIVVDETGAVIAAAGNSRDELIDPTAHAEVLALRAAAQVRGDRLLTGCTIYVTLEPCPMCAGAVVMSRVDRLVFGAWNEEYGAAGSRWDIVRDRRLSHRPEVLAGVLADECGEIVRTFLADRRS
ncbi:MAG: nucleoside deaminase [Candidatus Nanopelagicales bacterium]|nr:nucleoside deaminase [Candidatus Nanopelagicales bacterium]